MTDSSLMRHSHHMSEIAVDTQELLSKRFQVNMSRVERLINLGAHLKQTRGQNPDELAALTDRPDEVADLHRSTVVFLHASFEDMLRTIADNRLGRAAKRTFGKVDVVVKSGFLENPVGQRRCSKTASLLRP